MRADDQVGSARRSRSCAPPSPRVRCLTVTNGSSKRRLQPEALGSVRAGHHTGADVRLRRRSASIAQMVGAVGSQMSLRRSRSSPHVRLGNVHGAGGSRPLVHLVVRRNAMAGRRRGVREGHRRHAPISSRPREVVKVGNRRSPTVPDHDGCALPLTPCVLLALTTTDTCMRWSSGSAVTRGSSSGA